MDFLDLLNRRFSAHVGAPEIIFFLFIFRLSARRIDIHVFACIYNTNQNYSDI